MADHFHGTGDLIRSYKAPAFALCRYLVWQVVLLGLEDCDLMKANGRSVNAHVGEDDIHIRHATRQSEMIGQ